MMSLPTSYLDHLDARLDMQGGRASLARLLLVATKGKGADDPDEIVRYHERLFEEILTEQHAAPITGVLIIQRESVVHLVETSMDTSTAFLRQIQSMQANQDPSSRVLEKVKILVSSEDCPSPYFTKWFHYDLQLNEENNVDINNEDPIEASWGVHDKLVELASEMRQHSGTSVSELKRKYSHLVPSNERVLGLAESENVMSLSEPRWSRNAFGRSRLLYGIDIAGASELHDRFCFR
ncbi:unnamed protein product [Ascophyllum nodosum]